MLDKTLNRFHVRLGHALELDHFVRNLMQPSRGIEPTQSEREHIDFSLRLATVEAPDITIIPVKEVD